MSLLSVTDQYIVIGRKLQIDVYNHSEHRIIDIPSNFSPKENDQVTDVVISSNNKYVAVITSSSKQLIVYELPELQNSKSYSLPRSASKIRFTTKNTEILVADKSGDVLIYNLNNNEDPGIKLLGHLSLLLDILQTEDEKYIITTDRDEKIRVSCYPNTYNIQTYCLGHKEFVNHVDLMPHDNNYLVSTSGDGTIKIWDYVQGKLQHTIDTFKDVDNQDLKKEFVKTMDEDGVEVDALPIVHFTATLLNDNTTLVAVTVHSYNVILIYSISNFNHKLEHKLKLDDFPAGIKFNGQSLYVYNDSKCKIVIYNISSNGILSLDTGKEESVFRNNNTSNEDNSIVEKRLENIKVLYKRKFDNVQEYQERKRQRLEKSGLKMSN